MQIIYIQKKYPDLYLKSDALPLAEVFEISLNISFKNLHLDAANFLSSRIIMESRFKKDWGII